MVKLGACAPIFGQQAAQEHVHLLYRVGTSACTLAKSANSVLLPSV
jgi:hypothetical protein